MGKQAPTGVDKESITVTDNRSGKTFNIPIKDNAIEATAFKNLSIGKEQHQGREEDEVTAGVRIYDPGFMNTAVIRSEITYINGTEGKLRYRGYPIEQLAEKSNYLEVCYLLMYGSLPTNQEYNSWSEEILRHTYVHVDLEQIVSAFRYDAHPMSIMISSLAALGAFAPEANPSLAGQTLYTKADEASLQLLDKQIMRLLGKSITIAAMAYRVRQGRPFNRPPVGLSYTETFLHMMDHLSEPGYRPNPVFAKALDILFILHADHELNAGTATVLQTGSTLVDPYSACAAACAALFGPLHGGANEAVIRMLLRINGPENVESYIEKVKKKEEVLSGFGHRVYKTSDPRSFIIRKTADEVFAVTGKDKLLDTAIALHKFALEDEYFKSRNLYPNVDFWSGLIYRAMGFPVDFYVVLFAVPRMVGWLAHWRQMMHQQGGVKIWRPRQIYVGPPTRNYVDIKQRKADETSSDAKKRPSKVEHIYSGRHSLGTWQGKKSLPKL